MIEFKVFLTALLIGKFSISSFNYPPFSDLKMQLNKGSILSDISALQCHNCLTFGEENCFSYSNLKTCASNEVYCVVR